MAKNAAIQSVNRPIKVTRLWYNAAPAKIGNKRDKRAYGKPNGNKLNGYRLCNYKQYKKHRPKNGEPRNGKFHGNTLLFSFAYYIISKAAAKHNIIQKSVFNCRKMTDSEPCYSKKYAINLFWTIQLYSFDILCHGSFWQSKCSKPCS